MNSFKLETDTTSEFFGDFVIENNSLVEIDGMEAIRQHMTIRFQIFLGEWFLDTSIGVPWFRDVLVKNPSFNVVMQVLKDVILDTPGVLQIITFEFDYTEGTREVSLDFQALTTEGVLDFSQIVELGEAA